MPGGVLEKNTLYLPSLSSFVRGSAAYQCRQSGASYFVWSSFRKIPQVVYAAGGRIRRVIQTSSGRRELLEDEGEYDVDMQVLDTGTMARPRRRLLYSCDDCEETWDTVCEQGIPSVCNVVGYGSPFSTEANAAIEVMCSTLGNACAGSTGDEVCDGQCVGDGEDGDDDDDDDYAERVTVVTHMSTRIYGYTRVATTGRGARGFFFSRSLRE